MKLLGTGILFLLLSFGEVARADTQMESLQSCIEDYASVTAYFARRIPTQILALDRRLFLLHGRVRYLQANYVLLQGQLKAESVTKYDRLMVGNALVSCETELARYRSYMTSLYYFVISALVSLIALIVYLMYIRFTGGRWNAPPFQPVGDQPHNAVK